MKTSLIVIVCLIGIVWVATNCSASCPPTAALALAAVQVKDTVSIEIKDKYVDDAVRMLFEAGEASYTLDPGFENFNISFSIKNAKFNDAVAAFCKATNLTFTQSGDVYVLSPRKKQENEESLSTAIEKMDELAGVVTIDIPVMNLREALWKVSPVVAGNYELPELESPEASFYRFPQKMAAEMLIAQATSKPNRVMDVKAMSVATSMVPISVGAYKVGSDSPKANAGKWMLTVFANQADPVELLSAMFRVSRTPFLLTGLESKSNSSSSSSKDEGCGKTITAQIFDTPLDQAVNMIAASAGMEIGYVSPNGLVPSEVMIYTIKPATPKPEAAKQPATTQNKGKTTK